MATLEYLDKEPSDFTEDELAQFKELVKQLEGQEPPLGEQGEEDVPTSFTLPEKMTMHVKNLGQGFYVTTSPRRGRGYGQGTGVLAGRFNGTLYYHNTAKLRTTTQIYLRSIHSRLAVDFKDATNDLVGSFRAADGSWLESIQWGRFRWS